MNFVHEIMMPSNLKSDGAGFFEESLMFLKVFEPKEPKFGPKRGFSSFMKKTRVNVCGFLLEVAST